MRTLNALHRGRKTKSESFPMNSTLHANCHDSLNRLPTQLSLYHQHFLPITTIYEDSQTLFLPNRCKAVLTQPLIVAYTHLQAISIYHRASATLVNM